MPYYDYKCPTCDKTIEIQHRISEEFECTCPTCKIKMNQLIGTAKVFFVGDGWTTPGLHTKVGT
jgi:putative FmdB family regulatory protein